MMSKLKAHFPHLMKAGWFPSLVFFIHCTLSLGFNAYERLIWLDVPMHVLGGVAIAYFFDAGIEYFERLGILRVGSRRAADIMVFGLVAAATIVWEFAEFLADTFFDAGAQGGIANVMKDQFMGLAGGIAYIEFFSRFARGALTCASAAARQQKLLAPAAGRRR